MKWTAENDNKLLIISHGKQLSTKDYAKIAKDFPEGPTPKAIQERYTKIRAKQLLKLKELGIGAPEADIPDLPGPAGEEESAEADEEADPGFVGAGMSTFGAGQATRKHTRLIWRPLTRLTHLRSSGGGICASSGR